MSTAHSMTLREVCARLHYSYETGRRMTAEGTFPIPALPRRTPKAHHRFSSLDVDRYLSEAATDDVRVSA